MKFFGEKIRMAKKIIKSDDNIQFRKWINKSVKLSKTLSVKYWMLSGFKNVEMKCDSLWWDIKAWAKITKNKRKCEKICEKSIYFWAI